MSIEVFDSLGSLGQISTISGYTHLRIFVEDNRLSGELQELLDTGYSSNPEALSNQVKQVLREKILPGHVSDILRSLAKLSESAKDVVILR